MALAPAKPTLPNSLIKRLFPQPLERFSNWYSLTYFIEGDFFLRKKPLSLLASVYSYWRTALLIRQFNTVRVPHPFPRLLRKWVGNNVTVLLPDQ
jgi:hypothetical protein